MGLFKDMLRSEESLFKDSVALDYDYLPKILPYRSAEQKHFATCIKPLLLGRNGRNLFTYGAPGIGKTAACRWVLRDLEEETEKVIPIYINCWKFNTSYKIMTEICSQLGIRFMVNKKTSELFEAVKKLVNKKAGVFVFDEIDKLEDFDFLYMVLEDIYRKSVFLITNSKEKLGEVDERIISRLSPEFLRFRAYNGEEVKGILRERMKYAFVEGIWDSEGFAMVAKKCAEVGDVRVGLYLMREAGNVAEERSSRKVLVEHVKEAIKKADGFCVNRKEELEEELQEILGLIKENDGLRIGELYKKYQATGGGGSYKNFQRKIKKLQEGRFISTKKVAGAEGHTTIIYYKSERKLTEF